MNRLKPDKQLAVIATLVEGCSIRSTERLTGVHRDTIMRLLVRVGDNCQRILDETMRNLALGSVQVDELWTYVQKKQARLSFEERFSRVIGDQYAFVAVDADTKLIPHFDVGKRDMVTAYRFMEGLKGRLSGHFQLTTDGFVPYIGAVDRAWGADSPDFAQLVKLYGAVAPGPARPAEDRGGGPSRGLGQPRPGPHLNELRGAPEPHDPDGVPAIHAAV